MARKDLIAFVDRVREDAELARQVAACGQDRAALLALARAQHFAIDATDLEAFAADYAARGLRPARRR